MLGLARMSQEGGFFGPKWLQSGYRVVASCGVTGALLSTLSAILMHVLNAKHGTRPLASSRNQRLICTFVLTGQLGFRYGSH